MSFASKIIKSGLSSAASQINRSDPIGQFRAGLDASGVIKDIPKPEIPDTVKNWKLNIENNIKVPEEVITKYVEPVKNAISTVKIPGGIEGLSRSNLPDLSTIATQAESKLSELNIDTGGLGMSSVLAIMKSNGDPTALIKQMDLGIDMPDVSTSLKEFNGQASTFDEAQMQSEIDKILAGTGANFNINISNYL